MVPENIDRWKPTTLHEKNLENEMFKEQGYNLVPFIRFPHIMHVFKKTILPIIHRQIPPFSISHPQINEVIRYDQHFKMFWID